MNNRPNIVYILADDMGYGDMGCNNPDSRIPTPSLDCLAQQGMRFTDMHSSSSVCTPSRYSILTGRCCWRTALRRGVLWPWDPALIEPERLTVAGMLRELGYRTACIGKWHLGWHWATHDGAPANQGAPIGRLDIEQRRCLERNIDYRRPLRGGPVDCGFDTYFGVDVPNFPPYTWFEDDHLADLPTEDKPDGMFGLPGRMAPGWRLEAMIPELTRRAVEYIHEQPADTPFFLYFALTSPHTPIVPNEAFVGKSGAGPYGDFVCEVDWVVGEILDVLERRGIADNTLLIFTSDNGPECIPAAAGGSYEHIRRYGHYSMGDLRGVKRDAWEGGHRVPFLARWPAAIPAGAVCQQLAGLGDLMATCAELTGYRLDAGEAEDSVSILPLLRGTLEHSVREHAVHHSCSGTFAIRKGKWVFIDAPSGDDNREPQWFKAERGYESHDCPGELFDLSTDLPERCNEYARHPEVVADLKALLNRIRGRNNPALPEESAFDSPSE